MAGPFQVICPRSYGPFGWTSIYYPVATNHDEAGTLGDAINSAEAGLMSNDVKIGTLRVSDMAQKGDVLLREPAHSSGQYNLEGEPVIGPADPNLAVPIKLSAGTTNRATKYVRGVPVSLVTHLSRAQFVPDQVWGANQVILQNALINKANIVTRVGGPPPILTPHLITVVLHYFVQIPINMSIRRAGRPFGLPRGRAPVG
jgi:hypothetical protein